MKYLFLILLFALPAVGQTHLSTSTEADITVDEKAASRRGSRILFTGKIIVDKDNFIETIFIGDCGTRDAMSLVSQGRSQGKDFMFIDGQTTGVVTEGSLVEKALTLVCKSTDTKIILTTPNKSTADN